jgi:protein PhnA
MARPAANACRRASGRAARRDAETAVEVRDAVGNRLADGDQVTLIEDLVVKGARQMLTQVWKR